MIPQYDDKRNYDAYLIMENIKAFYIKNEKS